MAAPPPLAPRVELGTTHADERRSTAPRWLWPALPNSLAVALANLTLPLFAITRLHGGAIEVAGIAAGLSAGSIGGALLIGHLIDRGWPPGDLQPVGGLLMGVSSLGMVLNPILTLLPLLGTIFGIGASTLSPVLTAYLVRMYRAEERTSVLAHLNMIGCLGWLVGVSLGIILLTPIEPQLTERVGDPLLGLLAVVVVASFAAALVGRLTLPHPHATKHDLHLARRSPVTILLTYVHAHPIERGMWLPLKQLAPPRWSHIKTALSEHNVGRSAVATYMAGAMLVFSGSNALFTMLPLLVVVFWHLPIGYVYLMLGTKVMCSMIGFQLVGRISSSGNPISRFVRASAVRGVMLGGLAVLLLFQGVPQLYLALGLVVFQAIDGIVWSFISISGTLATAHLAPPHLRGEVLGLYRAVEATGDLGGALLGGLLVSTAGAFSAPLGAGILLVGAALLLRHVHPVLAPEGSAPPPSGAVTP